MTAAPITAEELARAQRRAEADFVFQTNSVTAQARQLGYWAMIGDWRYLDDLPRPDPGAHAGRRPGGGPAHVRRRHPDRRPLRPGRRRRRPRRRRRARRRPASTGRSGATGPSPCPARRPPRRRTARCPASPSPTASRSSSRRAARPRPSRSGRACRPARSWSRADRPGVAGLTASMLSRGTERRNALEFATALEDVGAALGAGADTLVDDGHRARADPGLRPRDGPLRGDAAPALVPGGGPRAAEGRGAGRASPRRRRTRTASPTGPSSGSCIPPDHPLRPQTFEERETAIAAITRDDLVAFHRRQYGPDRMIVVVAGDVTPDRVREALEKRLGDWPRNPGAQRDRPRPTCRSRRRPRRPRSPSPTRARRPSSGATRAGSAGATPTSTPPRS